MITDLQFAKALAAALPTGWELHHAWTLADGEDLCVTLAPELMLLDDELPDGLALPALPVFRDAAPHAELILFTREAGDENVGRRAAERGARTVLSRELDSKALAAALHRFAGHR
jgi:DNA-binding NarL/FixJ family response regulator